jgi:hypothetical protein
MTRTVIFFQQSQHPWREISSALSARKRYVCRLSPENPRRLALALGCPKRKYVRYINPTEICCTLTDSEPHVERPADAWWFSCFRVGRRMPGVSATHYLCTGSAGGDMGLASSSLGKRARMHWYGKRNGMACLVDS